MREFLRLLPILNERRARQADAFIPADALLDPVFVPRFPAPVRISEFRIPNSDFRSLRDPAGNGFDDFIRPDEEFEFHLLEFAGAEGEVARVDLVAKRLPDLANAERHFLARNFQHGFELRENGLRGFRTKISDVFFALDRADIGLEHQVELAGWCEFSPFTWTILRVKAC